MRFLWPVSQLMLCKSFLLRKINLGEIDMPLIMKKKHLSQMDMILYQNTESDWKHLSKFKYMFLYI